MSWSERLPRRGLLGLGLCAALAACGFTPVYGPGQGGERLRGALAVQEPATRAAYVFAGQVETRLGRSPQAPYLLRYALVTTTESQAITPDQAILRTGLRGTAEYSVAEQATGRILTSGRVAAFTGYGSAGTVLTGPTVAREAERRLMVMLADRVVEELTLSGTDWLP